MGPGCLSDLRQLEAGNALRCAVFTEQIQPGMARREVENILERYGPYSVGQADFSEGNYSLRIRYTDPETWDRFGSDIYVNFRNHAFSGAALPYGVGESSPVCDR